MAKYRVQTRFVFSGYFYVEADSLHETESSVTE